MTTKLQIENRQQERSVMTAPTMVKGKEDENTAWKETTDLLTVSRNGAGFYLSRKCEVGQLLSLMIPMARHMRCYDRDKELYRVWGVVQHCHYAADKQSFQVGVAFVGKSAPPSYHKVPSQSYRIIGINEDGLWKITETGKPFITRKHPRFAVSLDITIATIAIEGTAPVEDKTTTENISLRGTAILSNLPTSVGECVRFSSKEPEFSVLAVVRNVHQAGDGMNRIHLEFITADFPIKEVSFPFEPTAETDKKEPVKKGKSKKTD